MEIVDLAIKEMLTGYVKIAIEHGTVESFEFSQIKWWICPSFFVFYVYQTVSCYFKAIL